jgi:bacteriophage N4 adsorption protein B
MHFFGENIGNPWAFIAFWQQELLFFSAFFFLLGAADDAVVDLIWVTRAIFRRFTIYRTQPPQRAQALLPPKQRGMLVIFVAVWQEALVIGTMLARTRLSWSESGAN